MGQTRFSVIAVGLVIFTSTVGLAQINVKTPGHEVKVGNGNVNVRAEGITSIATDGGNASVTVGGIGQDADIQGVTVINGRVVIDGKDVPANVTRYKSPKTGTVYLIQRKAGSVNVTTEAESRQ